jgi:hypothetical protein
MRLEDHIRTCPDCTADREETRRVLALVTVRRAEPVPDFDPESSWRKIRAGIQSPRRTRYSFLASIPTWGWAGAGLSLVLVAGILIGRFGFKSAPEPPAARGGETISVAALAASPELSIRPALASHLDDLRPVLLDFANSVRTKTPGPEITIDQRLLRGLLLQNILLRRALNGNDPAAAELLDDLDLVLKEILNGKGPGGASPAQVRNLILDRSILFRMQILKTT